VSVPRKNERKKSSPKAALVVSGVHVVRDDDDSSFCLASW